MTIEQFRQWAKSQQISLIDELDGFKTGEIVDVINGFGIIIKDQQIKGFRAYPDKLRPKAVVYVYNECYWFPIELSRIKKKS
ncbi:hypothetical protein [Bergeyella zoohelcum]|uniref:hypothetical protein n=1 Tax=Bergeyella zoohelcum TaxID=1015 RepID=UPI003736C0D5